jgi:hypothetical protein
MRTTPRHTALAILACTVALLQISPAAAGDQRESKRSHRNGPVDVAFTKWNISPVVLSGAAGGGGAGTFTGEVLENQHSSNPLVNPNPDPLVDPLNPFLNGILRLEALYSVVADDERESFTALIRGGQDQVTGVARFDGIILAGWRSGSRVQVTYKRHVAPDDRCLDAGAPVGANCFIGTIHVERAVKD